MKFNKDKCHTMRFTLLRKTINTEYNLGGSALTTVSEHPYLGLTLTSNLSWQSHIDIITAKANRMLGLIRRNLRGCSRKLRQQAYLSLVRPHLEYCSTVWNPHTKKNITKIEKNQRQAARFIFNNYHSRDSVSKMIDDLQWDSLEKRRQAASISLMYKIRYQLVAINPTQYLIPMIPSSTRSYHNVNTKPSQHVSSSTNIRFSHEQSCGGMPSPARSSSSHPSGSLRGRLEQSFSHLPTFYSHLVQ
ncbi:uncharacterized protein LOC117305719 [Asterias rubens]|uniref:uncharacterized protein LOC117305719 n=1 Tax=Asterias rubens TaxID=7604 RepID=UPI00145535D5|nr:uncharacterized protein LOC117305719 [Asterias rubens]